MRELFCLLNVIACKFHFLLTDLSWQHSIMQQAFDEKHDKVGLQMK